jgi:hypothetical protein
MRDWVGSTVSEFYSDRHAYASHDSLTRAKNPDTQRIAPRENLAIHENPQTFEFGGSMEEYRALFEKKHRVVEVLTRSDYRPEDYGSLGQRWFFVLKNRNTPADN